MAKNRIGELRREHGMNQRELGIALGVGQTTVSAWETGKNEPDNEVMHKMAQMFRVSIGFLAGYEDGYVDGIFTGGLTQAQLRKIREQDEEEELAEEFLRQKGEIHGLSDREIEKLENAERKEDWQKNGANMHYEAYRISQICEYLSKDQRQRLLTVAENMYPNAVKGLYTDEVPHK